MDKISNISDPYNLISRFYRQWQRDVNPAAWVKFTQKIVDLYLNISKGQGQGRDGSLLLADLGCGSGEISALMADKGFDVLAVDRSQDMLALAHDKYSEKNISFIYQDISRLDLFGTVDIMVSYMDTINHIANLRSLNSFFAGCNNFLNPGGLLIFDLLTEKYFTEVLGSNTFVEKIGQDTIIWENNYNEKNRSNTADITVFSLEEAYLYSREKTKVIERYYDKETVSELLDKNKLRLRAIYKNFDLDQDDGQAERLFYVVDKKPAGH